MEASSGRSEGGSGRGGEPSVVELVPQRLLEYEAWDWLGLVGLEGRSLVEQEVALTTRAVVHRSRCDTESFARHG